MFQDLVRNPLTVAGRKDLTNSDDFNAIHQAFDGELKRTRFVALGGPSESGTHILYQFRQENNLPTNSFPSLAELVTGPLDNLTTKWARPEVKRLIFIDDFLGTGQQVTDSATETVPQLRNAASNSGIDLEVWYLTLIATQDGLESVEATSIFQCVRSLSVLDGTYRVFDDKSQCFSGPPGYIDKSKCEEIMDYYGNRIYPEEPLGYGNCQLLLGFRHNVPDNTLPIIWFQGSFPWWRPIFLRSRKLSEQGSAS